MAACLPSDLLHCVLGTWLGADVDIISAMDVAVCNHSMRADFLHVIAQITCPCRDPINSLLNYLHWIASRKVKVSVLCMDIPDMEEVGKLGFISFPSIREIYFEDGEGQCDDFEIHYGLFALFLSKFPCLTTFRGWNSLTDDHLEMLRSFKYDLDDLDIQDCPNLSAEAVAEMITSVAHSLVKLHCASLDDETMVALSRLNFPVLKDMNIDCWHISESDSIEMLCAAVCATLQSLHLESDKPPNYFSDDDDERNDVLTHGLVKSITRMCKRLISFHFLCGTEEASRCLRAVFAHAPQIRNLRLGECSLYISEFYRGWIVNIASVDKGVAREIIAGIGGHVCHFTLQRGTLNDELLRLLAARLGSHISDIQTKFDVDVDDDTMTDVLPQFPNLECVCFKMDAEGDISDTSLTLLPLCCPKITDLDIFANISDEGMCAILDGYRGNKMTSLKFCRCKLLTDVTLNKIVATFPDLKCLEMSGTSVKKETVANLIATKKLRVKELGCSDGKWVEEKLESLGHKGTSVNSCIIC